MFERVRKLIRVPSTSDLEQHYLAQSANAYDLEMRQREIDRGLFRRQPHGF